MRKNLSTGAPEFMKKIGEQTDTRVFEEVKRRPGLTIREIAEHLRWTNGRVDGSVNRLVFEGTLRVQHCFRKGVLVKKVFPANYSAKLQIVEIPKELIDKSLWQKSTYTYALSRTAIGLSPNKREDWEKLAVRKQKVSISEDASSLRIELPQFFVDFYQLENSETTLSIGKDSALITVESTIVPVELPSTFPDLSIVSAAEMVAEVEIKSFAVTESSLKFKWDPTKQEEFRIALSKRLENELFKFARKHPRLLRETSEEANTLLLKVGA